MMKILLAAVFDHGSTVSISLLDSAHLLDQLLQTGCQVYAGG